ncbi:MAG: hypothetical protein H6814_09120 [Phycisphaeraceae bacterium]|nr:hypothetical protein [Phycisphaeraceae bacterium]
MTSRSNASRRGVALLIALLVLVTVSTLTVGAIRAAFDGSAEVNQMLQLRQVDSLVDDLAPPLLEWAARDADGWIASQDDPSGWAPVFQAESDGLMVRVHAIDCSGRLRVDRLGTFAGLGLPSEIQRLRVGHVSAPEFGDLKNLRPLLESFAGSLASPHVVAAFPGWFGEAPPHDRAVLVEWVTTHGDGALNVATAPLPLLQAALRGLDPAAVREILRRRRDGEPIPRSLIQTPDRDEQSGAKRVRLTTSSSAIGFMISAESRGVRLRWWVVAERLPADQLDGSIGVAYNADKNTIGAWRITESRRIAP